MNRLEERVADQSAEEVIRNALWGCHFAESEPPEMRESMKSVWTHEWERCESKTQRIISALESQGLKIVPVDEGKIWSELRAGISMNFSTMKKIVEADKHAIASVHEDELARKLADRLAAMLNAVEG